MQMHPVLPARLHPVLRNGPGRLVEVDLAPLRFQQLARARRGQDQELEGQACDGLLGIVQPPDERRHLCVGQSRKMAFAVGLPGQCPVDVVDRIVARPESEGLGRRTSRGHSLPPNSRRATPPICPDLIYDRHTERGEPLGLSATAPSISPDPARAARRGRLHDVGPHRLGHRTGPHQFRTRNNLNEP
jgi:hypothetical protein